MRPHAYRSKQVWSAGCSTCTLAWALHIAGRSLFWPQPARRERAWQQAAARSEGRKRGQHWGHALEGQPRSYALESVFPLMPTQNLGSSAPRLASAVHGPCPVASLPTCQGVWSEVLSDHSRVGRAQEVVSAEGGFATPEMECVLQSGSQLHQGLEALR